MLKNIPRSLKGELYRLTGLRNDRSKQQQHTKIIQKLYTILESTARYLEPLKREECKLVGEQKREKFQFSIINHHTVALSRISRVHWTCLARHLFFSLISFYSLDELQNLAPVNSKSLFVIASSLDAIVSIHHRLRGCTKMVRQSHQSVLVNLNLMLEHLVYLSLHWICRKFETISQHNFVWKLYLDFLFFVLWEVWDGRAQTSG